MSREWNLGRLDDFSPDFMQRGPVPRFGRGREARVGHRSKSTYMAVVTAALMASQVTVLHSSVSSPRLTASWSVPSVQRNERERRPPFASRFDHRFGEQWTREEEGRLLDIVETRRKKQVQSASDVRMAVLEINQREASAAPTALSSDQIKRILAKRSLG